MKTLAISATLLLASAGLWATHLPSPNPINGAFIVMCCAAGMTFRALMTVEADRG